MVARIQFQTKSRLNNIKTVRVTILKQDITQKKILLMSIETSQKIIDSKVKLLSLFKADIYRYCHEQDFAIDITKLNLRIKCNVKNVRSIVAETRCLKLFSTIPLSIRGITIRDRDPFDSIISNLSFDNCLPVIVDMINSSISILESPEYLAKLHEKEKKNI